MKKLARYLNCKREDDLRMAEDMPRSRQEIPLPCYRIEIRAVRKALAYLRGWRPDVPERSYHGLLVAAGHRVIAIDMTDVEGEPEIAAETATEPEEKDVLEVG
jgi:hypothetical protein